MKTPEELAKEEAFWQRIGEQMLKEGKQVNYYVFSYREYVELEREFERLKKIEETYQLSVKEMREKHGISNEGRKTNREEIDSAKGYAEDRGPKE